MIFFGAALTHSMLPGQAAGCKSVNRMIAFLKSTPREVHLLNRIPTGLSRIVPFFEKNERNERI